MLNADKNADEEENLMVMKMLAKELAKKELDMPTKTCANIYMFMISSDQSSFASLASVPSDFGIG